MSFMVDTDARKVAEAKCYAPDDGTDPSWIEPRDPDDPETWDREEREPWGGEHLSLVDDPNDSDPEGQAALDRDAERAARDAWEINDIAAERLTRRVTRLWDHADAQAWREGREATMEYPLTPEDFRAAAARVVELRSVRVPEDSGAYDRRACCVRGKLGRSCDCVKF